MNLKELRAKQAQLVAEARERIDQIADDTPEARAKELETQHDAAMAEYDRLEERAQRLERLDAAEERTRNGNANDRPNREDRSSEEDRGGGQGELTYRSVFAKIVCGVQPSELEPEERAILRRGFEKGAKFGGEQRSQTAGTAAAGGYTVPTELATIISETMKATGPMYDENIVTVLETSRGNAWKLPTVDDTAVTAEAHTEGAALTDDGGKDVTFGQKSLDAYTFDTEFVRWSYELDNDSDFSFEALLGRLLGKRLRKIANVQLTTGTGSNAPHGIVTASSLGYTAAATAAITTDEIIELLHSVDPDYRDNPKSRFMLHDSTLKAIRKLKNSDGDYIWQMGDIRVGTPGTLLGKPYSINQAMDTLAAAKKVIVFGDFSEYMVRKVGQPVLGVMRERFWPDLGIAGLIRFDGELAQSSAVKHLITAAS